MEQQLFGEHIDTLRQRLSALQRCVEAVAGVPPALLEQVQAELTTALEEAQVAGEELREQNEELMSTRQAVEVERQRYQDLFEFAPDGYVVTDAHGRIQEANRATAALLGITQESLIGKPLSNLIVPQDRRALRQYMIQLCRHAPPQPEWEVRLQPRSVVPVLVALTVAIVHDTQGHVVTLRWQLRDSTARKRAEEELRRAKDAAEMADRTKSEFLATMSHELRTPLGVIIGYDDLLLDEAFGPLTPEQTASLRRMGSNARELLDLIGALLDLSRLEAGRLPIDLRTVHMEEVLGEVKLETQEVQEHSGLTFAWSVAEGLPPITTDPQKLKVVLKNLIGNAVKFTEQGNITVAVHGWEEGVEVRVTDTGIGIPPEALAVIFEPFRQVESALLHRHQGTGLGLHIVKRLLELLSGTVTVDSVVGHGSRFRVRLPFHPLTSTVQKTIEANGARDSAR